MKSSIILSVSFFLLFQMIGYSQKKCILIGGTTSINKTTGIRATELTVREYLDFFTSSNYDSTLLPEQEILETLPYRFLFEEVKNKKSKYLVYYWMGDIHTGVYLKKLKNKEEEKYLSTLLSLPITGIKHENAVAYCAWLTKVTNERTLKGRGCKVLIELPSKQDYQNLIPNLDSVCLSNCLKETNYNFNFNKVKVEKESSLKEELAKYKLVRVNRFKKDLNHRYNLQGNAAEMTSTKGISMGGSFIHDASLTYSNQEISYIKPEIWLGFRFILRVLQ
jgi:hypothetical protein